MGCEYGLDAHLSLCSPQHIGVRENGTGHALESSIAPDDWHRELVLVGMQLVEGISAERFHLLRHGNEADLADVCSSSDSCLAWCTNFATVHVGP